MVLDSPRRNNRSIEGGDSSRQRRRLVPWRGTSYLGGVMLLALLVAACGATSTPVSSANSARLKAVLAASPKGFHLANYIQQAILHNDKLTIYVDYYAPALAFAAPLRAGVAEAAKQLGVDASVVGPTSGTAGGQVSQLETIIAAHQIDGIAITAASDSALNPVIAKAYNAGIPVISVNSDDPGSKQMAYVGQQLVPSGQAAGHELLKLLHGRKGKVVVFSLATGAGWSQSRMQGFMDAVRGAGLDIVGPVNTGTDPTTGYSAVASTMTGNTNAVAIVSLDCCSLDLAAEWVAQSHLATKPIVVGFDILAATKSYIESGVIQATVTQNAPLQGYWAVKDLAEYLLHGTPIHNVNTGEHIVTSANVRSTAAT